MSTEDQKPTIEAPVKSSMEILSELFSTFDADPPVIVKKEKDGSMKRHKKSKKKHKHKDKKHKKKSKKRKRSNSSSSNSGVDLTDILREIPEVVLKGTPDAQLNETDDKIIKTEPINVETKHDDEEKQEILKDNNQSNNISTENENFETVFDATILAIKKQELSKTEEGEITDSELSNEKSDVESKKEKIKKDRHKRKHKQSKRQNDKAKTRKYSHKSQSEEFIKINSMSRSSSRTPEKNRKEDSQCKDWYKSKESPGKEKDKFRDECKDESKEYKSKYYDDHRRTDHKSRMRSDHRNKDQDDFKRSKEKDYCDDKKWKTRENPFYYDYIDRDDKWFMRERYRGYSDRERDRERNFREKSLESHIDKKKLLEIARKNAIQMMKSGSLPGALTLGPQAQEKVIAAIKSGGKTVEELTDFCKTLSRKEELGELSSVSEDIVSESDSEKPFHHPFQLKERPVSITMNIKNSVPLPLKNSHERSSELRIQFPVSSGQQHRKTEKDWVPVSSKKLEASASKPTTILPTISQKVVTPLAIAAPPITLLPLPLLTPGPQVFPPSSNLEQNIDIGAIVSQRLSAMRKLQENPNDVQALSVMYKAQKEMNTWAESKQQIGQFTGSTGAQILTQAELSSGFQAWARKDQLQTATPVSGGMGMHLLQKMGWKPGEGLGKEKTGALEPLLLEVKLDKKGIVAKEEQKKKQLPKLQKSNIKVTQGKHPVSLLGEYASKHKLGAPQYDLCFECGPDHKKNFLFRVILNGVEYKPQIASPNKKEAKANAALICLQQLGIFLV